MRRINRDRLAAVLALGAIIVLVVGVPVVLIRTAGWPLPRSAPDWSNVRRAIGQGDIPADVVVKVLAVIVWLIWLQLLWALIWEVAINVPRLTAGHRPRSAPLVAAPVGNGIGRLVAAVLAIGVVIASTPAVALPGPPTGAFAPRSAPLQSPSTTTPTIEASTQSSANGPTWNVERTDSLWKIAEAALGDGERSGEILELNRWLGSARHLKASQVLTLPHDATVPTDRMSPHREPAVVGPAPDSNGVVTYLASTHIAVEPGDTLWDLSEARLAAVDHDVTPSETLAHVNEVIAANPDVIEDPDLIYPGEVFSFPAVGEPPAEPDRPSTPQSPTIDVELSPEADDVVVDPPEAIFVPAPTGPDQDVETPATSVQAVTPSAERAPAAPATVTSSGVERTDETHTTVVLPWLAGVSGVTALASGLLLLYRRRLAVRAARGAGAYRASTPDDPTVLTAVTRASDVSLLQWANGALAELTARLRPGDVAGQPLAVELSETLGIEMLWTEANPVAPEPWEVGDAGWSWRLRYDPDTKLGNVDRPAAIPALVTIGHRHGNPLLLNLEAVGVLAVDGDDQPAEDFVRSIVVELAVGELLSDAFLVASGVQLDGLAAVDRVQQRDRDAAGDSLRRAVETSQSFLREHSLESMFEARLGDDAAGRESTIFAVDDDYAGPIDADIIPGLGACLVYTGASEGSPSVTFTDDGTAVLEPYGIEFDPVGLPLPTLESVSDLLDEASEPYMPPYSAEVTADESESDAAIDDDLGDDDAWHIPDPEVLVRVLGAPEVVGVSLGRIETSIVTYLACHGGRRRDEQVINAVWNGRAVEPKTLWNKISTIRAALGPVLVPPRLPNSPNVVMSECVMTDLTVLERVHVRSSDVAEAEALRLLLHGLDLIDGVPFDSAEYDWSFETQDHSRACEMVEAATLRCVEVAMDLGDVVAARHAVTQGLRALPMNEPLYRARMRVESAAGNPDGVRKALAELASAIGASSDGLPTRPEAETVHTARSLTASS